MKRSFLESRRFRAFMEYEQISDQQLRGLQNEIMRGEGEVIPGTGGVKKIRLGRSGGGKSGGYRVLFADFPEFGMVYLLDAYPKNVKPNLTPAERNQWRAVMATLGEYMRQHYAK